MPFRFILHIPRRTIKAILYGLVGLGILFIALTRTQVGRDGLRQQMERQFNQEYVGELHIGELHGNLLNRLYARDITFRDSMGAPVASIEAAYLKPSWGDVFSRTISMSSVTLLHPEINVQQGADSVWSLERVFSKQDDVDAPSRWSFTSATVRIIDGSVQVESEIPAPRWITEDFVFDYNQTQLDRISADLILEWGPESKLIDFNLFKFSAPELLAEPAAFTGQIVVEEERLSFNEMQAETGDNRVAMKGSIDRFHRLLDSPTEAFLELDILESRLDPLVMQAFFPRYPLADSVHVNAQFRGPLSYLLLDQFTMQHGVSQLAGSGALFGMPDSIAVVLSLDDSRLHADDLRAVFPESDKLNIPPVSISSLQLDGYGSLHRTPDKHIERFLVRADIQARSDAGEVDGRFTVQQEENQPLLYAATLNADSLNLAVLDTNNPASLLSGTFQINGRGTAIDELDSEFHVGLDASHLAGRELDSLDFYVSVKDRLIDTQLMAEHPDAGKIQADALINLNSAPGRFFLSVATESLDVGRLLLTDSLSSELNTGITLNGEGFDWQSLRGALQVDVAPSEMRYGQTVRPIPAHRTTTTLKDDAEHGQVLEVRGDALDFTAQGHVALEPLYALSQLWAAVITQQAEQVYNKPRFITITDPAVEEWLEDRALNDTVHQYYTDQMRTKAQNLIEAHSLDPTLSVNANLRVNRSDIVSSWLPFLPPLRTNGFANLNVDASAEQLEVWLDIAGDSLQMGRLNAFAGVNTLNLEAEFGDDLGETDWTLTFSSESDSLFWGKQPIRGLDLTAEFTPQQGRMDMNTRTGSRNGTQRVTAVVDFAEDRNLLRIEEMLLSIGHSTWTLNQTTPIELYRDAVYFPLMQLESINNAVNLKQQIEVEGTISSASQDTAFFRIKDIALRPFIELVKEKDPLGGLLNAELRFTTVDEQPELTGNIHVNHASINDRVLGDLTVASRYLPGTPDIGLHVELKPVPEERQSAMLPDARVASTYELNDLEIDGRFRLPRFEQDRSGYQDAGAFDLDVTMNRADAFFFEFIFPELLDNVEGYLTGPGAIKGDFSYPLFEADFDLVDGKLDIPKFNLQYTDFDSRVLIDQEAIRLENGRFTDPTGGLATIDGSFLFNEYRYFSFDLLAQLTDLQIMNVRQSEELPFYGQIWSSGNLTLDGPAFNAVLLSEDAITRSDSELFIPVTEDDQASDAGFLIFADSTGQIPDIRELTYRRNILSKKPEAERKFLDGLTMDLNMFAPSGSTIHLVFDPLLGDVVNAIGSGRIQIQKREGEFSTFGTLNVDSGDYLFTAGEVFARRFSIESGGSITWDGDPLDARLNIPASYRTRASSAGLSGQVFNETTQIPLIVNLDISGRVSTPAVDLSLEIDRRDRNISNNYEGLEAILSQTERQTDFASSVLLTNSFLLTPESGYGGSSTLTNSGNQLAFSSVSQLVASQLNRFLNEAVPNLDLNLGLQGESLEDPDLTYGVALYLLDERLVIRGQGVYQDELQDQPNLEGEFVVEVRLNENMSAQIFWRREGDVLSQYTLTRTAGAGLSYQTKFTSWKRFFKKFFGKEDEGEETPVELVDQTTSSDPPPPE